MEPDELRRALQRYVGEVSSPDAGAVRRRTQKLVRAHRRRRSAGVVFVVAAVVASLWSVADLRGRDVDEATSTTAISRVDPAELLDAARAGDVDEAQSLLALGAPVDVVGRFGVTPLMIAAVRSDTEMAELLLDSGARPGARDRYGRATIHIAARFGSVGVIELLVAEGVSPDERVHDVPRTTATMVAAMIGEPDVIRALAAAGADLDIVDNEGRTALDYARESSTSAVAERTLLQLGAHDDPQSDQ